MNTSSVGILGLKFIPLGSLEAPLAHIWPSGNYIVISVLDDLNSVIASVSYERKTVEENNELAQEDDAKEVAQ